MALSLKRWDHLLNKHLQHAWTCASRNGLDPHIVVEREARVFGLIRQADPTDGRYIGWLSGWRRRQWQILGLGVPCSIGQIDEISVALIAFERARPSLPLEFRDIGRFTTAEELNLVATRTAAAPNRSTRKQQREEAMDGSTILFASPPWSLVKVSTEAAARWWGQGTRWCTAARENNRFSHYNEDGELLVLSTPTGRYQLASATGEFKDASDRDASPSVALAGAPAPLAKLLRTVTTEPSYRPARHATVS